MGNKEDNLRYGGMVFLISSLAFGALLAMYAFMRTKDRSQATENLK